MAKNKMTTSLIGLRQSRGLGTQFLLLIHLEIPPVCSLIRCALLSIWVSICKETYINSYVSKTKSYGLSSYRAIQQLYLGKKSNSRKKKETRQKKKKFPRKTSRLSEYPNIIPALTAMGAHEHPTFNELRAHVVSPRIFVRSQSLIAR